MTLQLKDSAYRQKLTVRPDMLPLPDEEHIGVWRGYTEEARQNGAFRVLSSRLPQFWFPVRAGMAKTSDYSAALKKGVKRELLSGATGLILKKADELKLFIHSGRITAVPVLFTPDREDFITLLQALAMRHEPLPVPSPVGAATITGLNNWDRIAALRSAWETLPEPKKNWKEEFINIRTRKELYQDRIIILGGGFYGNIIPREMGMTPGIWRKLSFKLRLEHELTHVLTARFFKPAANSLLDELIAETAAIIRTAGEFRTDWLFKFWGLENGQDGSQGLLDYYTDGAAPEMKRQAAALVRAAACNIQKISACCGVDWQGQLATISRLANYDSLDDLAEKRQFF